MSGPALRLLGVPEGSILGTRASSFLSAGEFRRARRAFVRLLRHPGESVTLEHPITCRDGSWRLCESVFTNLLHEDAVNGILWNGRDITDRFLAEQALRRSQARYRRLSESGLIGVFEGELGGPIQYANPAFLQMLGYSAQDVVNLRLSWESICLPEFASGDDESTALLRSEGRLGPAHRELKRADGASIPVLAGSALLELGSNRVIGLVIDMTEQVRIRRELRHTEQRYQTLFANANDFVFTVDNAGILTSFNKAGR